MKTLKLKSFAKINLSLALKDKKNDGYHNIDTIMQTISLHDIIKLQKNRYIFCEVDSNEVPTDEKNLAVKSAKIFFKALNISGGIKITIKKNIPTQAGLGGGSANAATTLIGLNKIYNTNLSYKYILNLAKKIGSDVPFLINGGTAKITGVGEKIKNITPIKNCNIVIVKPNFNISTKKAYEKYDNIKNFKFKDTNILTYKIKKRENLKELSKDMFNDFENVLNVKEIFYFKNKMLKLGAFFSLLSGSGSAIFGLFDKKSKANLAKYFFENIGLKSFSCTPVKKYFEKI